MIVTEATHKLGENISVLKEVREIPSHKVNFEIKLANIWIISQKISSDHLNLIINSQHSFLFRYFISSNKVTLAYPVKYNKEIVRGFNSLDNLICSLDLKVQRLIQELHIEQPEILNINMTNTAEPIIQNKPIWSKIANFMKFLWEEINTTDLQNIDLSGADFVGQNFDNVNFTNSILRESDLSVASLRNCDLSHTDLTGVDFRYADLTNANLTNANLTNANLTGANLSNANLTNADLTNVILTDASLIKINLTNAKLSDVIQQKILFRKYQISLRNYE